jgi:hypothetical protein
MRTVALRAFECGVRGRDWKTVINHLTAGKARYEYLLSVREYWPDLSFKDITVRTLGRSMNTRRFLHTKEHRGVTFNIGDRVIVGAHWGWISDSDDSANFKVILSNGNVIHVHPSDIALYEQTVDTNDAQARGATSAPVE